jgi:nucleotide sugar dehydrogenase
MAHYPSCGVGGHCIPVDPYYLIERAKQSGFDHRFLKIAREINNSMPIYAVELLQDLLNDEKLALNGTTVGVLGIAYKANIDDLRESPALKVIDVLKHHKAKVITHDPHVPTHSSEKTLTGFLKKSTAIILATDHREFRETITPELLKKHGVKIFIDGKNAFSKADFAKHGVRYHGIGRA